MSVAAPRRRRAVVAGAAVLLAIAGCGDAGTRTSADAGYPLTVENCGVEVTIEAPPERVVLLKSASVPYLAELGVLDRVAARAGAYPREYYDDSTWAELEGIPALTDRVDSSGHLQISREEVLALEPDLVLGTTDAVDHAAMAAAGIPLLEEPALCPEPPATPTFDTVAGQLRSYGQVFGEEERARTAADALAAQVEQLAVEPTGRTAAVLYPTVGGGTTYAYGTRSMADPQLTAAGLTNVFADVDERVFEVTLEELIGRDPGTLVLLHSDGDPAAVEAAVRALPGADRLTALREGRVVTQLFNFTEPPSPLAVEGLRRIAAVGDGAP